MIGATGAVWARAQGWSTAGRDPPPHREDVMGLRPALLAAAAAIAVASSLAAARAAPFMIVGNDEKLLWDDNFKPVLSPPGKDSVLIVDLADPLAPKIVANLALKNSVIGPPVNPDIDPTGSTPLVADSVEVIKDG